MPAANTPPDLLTARLRLPALTPARLTLQRRDPAALARQLHATAPPGWPGPDWDAPAYAFVRRQWRTHPATVGWHRYVLLPTPSPVLIGMLGSHPLSATEAELGYGILPPWQNLGYATEATRALIAFLFRAGNLCVSAQTYPDHAASLRIMKKCNMTPAGPGAEPGCVRYTTTREAFSELP